jgi:hypothetical protein
MLKHVTAAALAAAALTAGQPAYADEPVFGCYGTAGRAEAATGQNLEGAVFGYAFHATGGLVSIHCFYTVNGTEIGSTDISSTSTRQGVAAMAARVQFGAEDSDDVTLWARVTTTHGTFLHAYETTSIQLPPQAVLDAVQYAADSADDSLCATTKPVGAMGLNVLGLVMVERDGDIVVNGTRALDCP